MTMTHDNDDEEKILLDQLLTARHNLELHNREAAIHRAKKSELEHNLEVIEQAFADYLIGNGIKQTTINNYTVDLGYSESIDAPDIAAVPEEYIRIKEVREINKALVRAKKPEGCNWYIIKQSPKLTVRSK